MSTIKDEITDIAVANGFKGEKPKTKADAVNALGSVIGGSGSGESASDDSILVVVVDGNNKASVSQQDVFDAADNNKAVLLVKDRVTYMLSSNPDFSIMEHGEVYFTNVVYNLEDQEIEDGYTTVVRVYLGLAVMDSSGVVSTSRIQLKQYV